MSDQELKMSFQDIQVGIQKIQHMRKYVPIQQGMWKQCKLLLMQILGLIRTYKTRFGNKLILLTQEGNLMIEGNHIKLRSFITMNNKKKLLKHLRQHLSTVESLKNQLSYQFYLLKHFTKQKKCINIIIKRIVYITVRIKKDQVECNSFKIIGQINMIKMS